MKIPTGRQWTQLNEGEVTGALHDTRNIALDTVGQLRLARRPVAVMSSAQDADFGYVRAIVYFDNKYCVVTDNDLFAGQLDGTPFTQITDFTPTVTNYSDAIVFNNRLVVTLAANVADWDGATDDNYTLAALTSGVPHPMAIFDSNPTYKLAIGNGNTVKTYDTSYAANPTTLTISSDFIVTSLRYRNGYLYVGTKNIYGGEARIFIWNGSGTNAQYECPVGAEWVFSMTEYGSSIAAVTSAGQLIQVSGSQYVELAAFPIYHYPHASWARGSTVTSAGKVYNRGMVTIGNTIYINIEGDVDTGFIPEMQSGIWVYDPEVGLYHRASSSTDLLRKVSVSSVSNNILTLPADHSLKTGDGVQFYSVSGLTGVSNDYVYYVTVVDTDQIKLSLSREGVVRGDYVAIAGTPTASDDLVYIPNTDNGSIPVSDPGAIAAATINESPLNLLVSEVLWGSRSYEAFGGGIYVLNCFADQSNIGSFTTQRIYTDNITQSWRELFTFLDGVVTETDKVVIKTQTKSQSPRIELNGIWTATNTLSIYDTAENTAWLDIEEGDEIVFTLGIGQGKTAHVTAIETSASTVTITLDESFGTVSSRVDFYRTNFKKIGEYTSDNKENEYLRTTLFGITSPWIKIKVELRGIGTAVNMLELSNVAQKST